MTTTTQNKNKNELHKANKFADVTTIATDTKTGKTYELAATIAADETRCQWPDQARAMLWQRR